MDELKIMDELLKTIQKAENYEAQRRMIEWLGARCSGDERKRLTIETEPKFQTKK